MLTAKPLKARQGGPPPPRGHTKQHSHLCTPGPLPSPFVPLLEPGPPIHQTRYIEVSGALLHRNDAGCTHPATIASSSRPTASPTLAEQSRCAVVDARA